MFVYQPISSRSGYASPDPQLNPHAVLPPINTQRNVKPPPLIPNGGEKRHFPEKSGTLPVAPTMPLSPIVLSKTQENMLKKSIREDIRNLDFQRLKDLYVRLANYDLNLSGFVRFQDLEEVLNQSEVD